MLSQVKPLSQNDFWSKFWYWKSNAHPNPQTLGRRRSVNFVHTCVRALPCFIGPSLWQLRHTTFHCNTLQSNHAPTRAHQQPWCYPTGQHPCDGPHQTIHPPHLPHTMPSNYQGKVGYVAKEQTLFYPIAGSHHSLWGATPPSKHAPSTGCGLWRSNGPCPSEPLTTNTQFSKLNNDPDRRTPRQAGCGVHSAPGAKRGKQFLGSGPHGQK